MHKQQFIACPRKECGYIHREYRGPEDLEKGIYCVGCGHVRKPILVNGEYEED